MRRTMLAVGMSAAALVTLAACSSADWNSLAANSPASGGKPETNAQSDALPGLIALMSHVTSSQKTAHVQFQSDQLTAAGQAQFGHSLAEQMTATVQGQQTQLIYTHNTFYLQSAMSQQQAGGKQWVEVAPNDADRMSKALGQISDEMRQYSDPGQLLGNLKDAGALTKTTAETLNGQPVTHYTITVDMAKLLAGQPNDTLKQLAQTAISAGVASYPVDIWVKSNGLPVKMVVPEPAGSDTSPRTVTITYSAWGQPVNIQAPSAAQVGTMPAN